MAFINSHPTQRLTPPSDLGFGPDEWLEVRTVLTAGIRQRVMQKSMKVHADQAGAASTDLDVFAYRGALIQEIVVAWSDPTPPTPESLQEMSSEVQDWISAEFDRLSAGRSAVEKNPLSGSSPSGPPPTLPDGPTSSPTSMRSDGLETTE